MRKNEKKKLNSIKYLLEKPEVNIPEQMKNEFIFIGKHTMALYNSVVFFLHYVVFII